MNSTKHSRFGRAQVDQYLKRRRGVCNVGSAIGIVAGSFLGAEIGGSALLVGVMGDIGASIVGKAVGRPCIAIINDGLSSGASVCQRLDIGK